MYFRAVPLSFLLFILAISQSLAFQSRDPQTLATLAFNNVNAELIETAHRLAAKYGHVIPPDSPHPRIVLTYRLSSSYEGLYSFTQPKNILFVQPKAWKRHTLEGKLALLIHELLHWRQFVSGWAKNRPRCALERDAYVKTLLAMSSTGYFKSIPWWKPSEIYYMSCYKQIG